MIGAPAPDEDHELKALQHQIAFYKREIADLKNKRNSLRARTDQRSTAGLPRLSDSVKLLDEITSSIEASRT